MVSRSDSLPYSFALDGVKNGETLRALPGSTFYTPRLGNAKPACRWGVASTQYTCLYCGP